MVITQLIYILNADRKYETKQGRTINNYKTQDKRQGLNPKPSHRVKNMQKLCSC